MDACVAMESSREPHYHSSDNLKQQAPQECGAASGKVYEDSDVAVCNAEAFARLFRGNVLAKLSLSSHFF